MNLEFSDLNVILVTSHALVAWSVSEQVDIDAGM